MTVVDIQQRRGTTSPLGAWRLFWAGKFGRPAIGAWDASGFYRDGKLCGRCLRPDGRFIYRPLTPDEEAEYLKSAAW